MFTVTNHRLAKVPFVATPNQDSWIEPVLIIVYDTADRLHPDIQFHGFATEIQDQRAFRRCRRTAIQPSTTKKCY